MAIIENTWRASEAHLVPGGLSFASVESTHLCGRGDVCLAVTPGAETATAPPLVLLLHGAYGASWHWAYRGGAHLIAARLAESGSIGPTVLAMPGDGGVGASTGYFAPAIGNQDFERWIMEDVPALARLSVPAVNERSPLFIAGYSLGGFGALRLAARHHRKVMGVAAHSAVTALDQLPEFLSPDSRAPVPRDPRDAAVWPWIRQVGPHMPPLRFDCGTGDQLLNANRALAHALRGEGIAHDYREYEGGHDFDYWQARLPETLQFFSNLAHATHARAP